MKELKGNQLTNPEFCLKSFLKISRTENGRSYYRCEPCWTFADTIGKAHSYRGKLPGLCSSDGVVYRQKEIEKHVEWEGHKLSLAAWNHSKLTPTEVLNSTPILKYIYKENEALANRIGGFMVEIYNNAKRGSVAAFSWPSIHIAQSIGAEFKMNEEHKNYTPEPSSFQYLTPLQHADLMGYIVKADMPNLRKRINSSLPRSLSVDGSVDKFQTDNKHVMCKKTTQLAQKRTFFLDLMRQLKEAPRDTFTP